jgi:hypothetical protein
MRTCYVLALSLLGLGRAATIRAAEATTERVPVVAVCCEQPSSSFPPNQLLRREQPDHTVVSVLTAAAKNQWAEFFVEVPATGTYRVAVRFIKGPDEGVCQLEAFDEPVGHAVNLYAQNAGTVVNVSIGDVTFLRAGNYSLRFVTQEKDQSSSGNSLVMQKITLEPVQGFMLAAPNGACFADGNVLFRWNAWPGAKAYRVEVDGNVLATVDAPATDYPASNIALGTHRWRIIALAANAQEALSNMFAFVVGPPPPSPYRDYSIKFTSDKLDGWTLQGMTLAKNVGGQNVLQANGPASAILNDIQLEKAEAEISTNVVLASNDALAGAGFQSDDGTRIYGVADVKRRELRLERRVTGYSIFNVTPKAYQMKQWAEHAEGDAMVWEIAQKPVALHAGSSYQIKLAFSRRSNSVMATLIPSDGSETVTVRALCDVTSPDHPLLVCAAGRAQFADAAYHHLNKLVYKWDPDTVRIVLRPGEAGSWDARGAFNAAVVIRGGVFHMVYRGNAKPAPPNGPAASELGLATSTDGVHWTKSPANPIIPRRNGKGTQEDPDLLWPKDSDRIYLEYRTYDPVSGEVMCSSIDWLHWSAPWICNSGKTFGKMGGMLDLWRDMSEKGIIHDGVSYRYLTMIEEGRIDLSNDLKSWTTAGVADLKGKKTTWCDSHECSGDIFVDHDNNIRYESQAGVEHIEKHGPISGNPLCTIVEGVLDGSNPTKVLWKSDLPWLPDWYGDAPTGAPEDFTATNGSVFPGQTVIKDGWLWHYSGGNNTFTLLCKCWYGPLWESRNLQAEIAQPGQCIATATVRNAGSLPGNSKMVLSIDGQSCASQEVSLDPDAETTIRWEFPWTGGRHTLSVDDLSIALANR